MRQRSEKEMATKTKTKAKRKRSGVGTAIYVVILILWILFLAACGLYVLKQVYDYASVYDETQIDPVIEDYFAQLQANKWSNGMDALVKTMPHPTKTDEEVKELIQQKLNENELSYAVKPGFARSDNVTYNIYCGSDIIGEVVLVHDTSRNLVEDVYLPSEVVGVLAKMGVAIQPELYPWKVAGESFDFAELGLYSSIRVTVPETYRVEVDGVTLSDQYIIERGIEYDNLHNFYYEFDNLPHKVTYKLEESMGDSNVVIYDENGNVVVIDENKSDSQFMQKLDDATLEGLAGFINDFANNFLQMRSNTIEPMYAYSMLLPYIKQGSEMDNRLKQSMIDTWSHNSYYQFNGSQILDAYDFVDPYVIVEFHADASAQQPAGPNVISSDFRAMVDMSGPSPLVEIIEDM